jgi:hypothetical protein
MALSRLALALFGGLLLPFALPVPQWQRTQRLPPRLSSVDELLAALPGCPCIPVGAGTRYMYPSRVGHSGILPRAMVTPHAVAGCGLGPSATSENFRVSEGGAWNLPSDWRSAPNCLSSDRAFPSLLSQHCPLNPISCHFHSPPRLSPPFEGRSAIYHLGSKWS